LFNHFYFKTAFCVMKNYIKFKSFLNKLIPSFHLKTNMYINKLPSFKASGTLFSKTVKCNYTNICQFITVWLYFETPSAVILTRYNYSLRSNLLITVFSAVIVYIHTCVPGYS